MPTNDNRDPSSITKTVIAVVIGLILYDLIKFLLGFIPIVFMSAPSS